MDEREDLVQRRIEGRADEPLAVAEDVDERARDQRVGDAAPPRSGQPAAPSTSCASTSRSPATGLREISAAVAFLASDDAAYVTGAELAVDGGYLAR